MCEIEFIKSIQKVDIKDGDIIIIKHPLVLSSEARKRLGEAVKNIMKDCCINNKVMVLDEGMDIGVLSRDKSND